MTAKARLAEALAARAPPAGAALGCPARAGAPPHAAAAHVLDGAIRLPDRSSMVFSVTRSHRPAKPHLQQPECDVESKHQHCSPDTNPQAEPFFQLGADDVAIAVEQDRDHEEAAAGRYGGGGA